MKQKCYKRNPIKMFGHNSVLSLDSFPAFLNDPRNPNKMFYVLPKQIFEIILKSTWISRPDTIGFFMDFKNTFICISSNILDFSP